MSVHVPLPVWDGHTRLMTAAFLLPCPELLQQHWLYNTGELLQEITAVSENLI